MTNLEISSFESLKELKDNPDLQEILLQEAFATGDSKAIAYALDKVAKARGISELAQETGITRQALHHMRSPKANPSLKNLLNLLSSLGYEMTVKRNIHHSRN